MMELMDLPEAARIVRALADGIDPATGEILAETSPFNSVDVVRALHVALEALSRSSAFNGPEDASPGRNGRPWTPEEDAELKRAFEAGEGKAAIMAAHQRSAGGISSRLVKLGLIGERREFRAK